MHPPGPLAGKKEPTQGFCLGYTLMGTRGQVEEPGLWAGLGPAIFPAHWPQGPAPSSSPGREGRTGLAG